MKSFVRGLLVVALLIGVGASLGGRLSELLPLDVLTSSDASLSSSTVVSAPPPLEAADQDASAAVQQVIQHSNDEQVQAIASRDVTVMADTLTSDHYQEL